jgi:hypothetical protein
MDRGAHVHITCENLGNYQYFKDLIQAKPQVLGDSVGLACIDANVALRYGWAEAAAYSLAYQIDAVEKNGRKAYWVCIFLSLPTLSESTPR